MSKSKHISKAAHKQKQSDYEASEAIESEAIKTEQIASSQTDLEQTDTLVTSSPKMPDLELPGALAERYEVIQPLGSGTQGKVYQVRRRTDGTLAALKILRIDSIKTWKEYTLFHREAEVLSSLDIPGIAKFYEACDCLDNDPPCSCIVQQYIEGATLKCALADGYRFSLAQVYDIALQLIDILDKLHTHTPPVIHRDIKPSNIILQPNDNHFKVFLIDFGAVANPQVQSGGSTVAGTYGYMSPEQHIGRPTPQSDTYALAALLAYMLSGVDPADMKIQNLRLIIDPYVEHHPPALVQTLRRMLDPDIDKRLADLNELRERFQSFKKGNYTLSNEPSQPFSKQEFKERILSVKSLGESQNLEIWQNLPDIIENRFPFPVSIKTNPRFAGYPIQKKERVIWLWLFMMIIIIPLSIGCIGEGHVALGATVLAFCILSTIIGVLLSLIPTTIQEFRINNSWTAPEILYLSINKTRPCPQQEMIYKFGRKTIATVTHIEYMSHKVVDYLVNDNCSSGRHRLETPPTFKIWYKFNPPDDDNPNDIFHTITTHRDPQDMLKPGSPLPILYASRQRQNKSYEIISLPYPFPLEDLEYPDDYIGGQHTIEF